MHFNIGNSKMSNLTHSPSQHAQKKDTCAQLSFTLAALVACLILTTFSNTAAAARQRVMLGGYDPVSYFSPAGPRRGKASIAVKYRGAKYVFRSAENVEKFLADPALFLPQFGGNCAYGMAFGSKSSINPRVWRVIDGKLYMHINRGTLRVWNKKPNYFIKRASKAWKVVGKR